MAQVVDPDIEISDSFAQVLDAGLNRANEKLAAALAVDINLQALTSGKAAIDQLLQYLDSEDFETVSISQSLQGDLAGQMLLMVSGDAAITMTRELLDEQAHLRELTDVEEEALQEIGNVLINAFLTSYLEISTASLIQTQMPTLMRGQFHRVMDNMVGDTKEKRLTYLSMQITTAREKYRALLIWPRID